MILSPCALTEQQPPLDTEPPKHAQPDCAQQQRVINLSSMVPPQGNTVKPFLMTASTDQPIPYIDRPQTIALTIPL